MNLCLPKITADLDMRSRKDLPSVKLVEEATQTFLDWAAAFLYPVDDPFPRAKILATRLGAHFW